MRTEQEMFDLILGVAKTDERVRAVYMNGSRTNPNVAKKDNVSFGRYGRLYREYLKKHRNSVYKELLYSGRLNTYLAKIDANSIEMLENLTREMVKMQGITEKLKASDQMAWVGAMNNIKACAAEIIFSEIVYA